MFLSAVLSLGLAVCTQLMVLSYFTQRHRLVWPTEELRWTSLVTQLQYMFLL